MEGSALLHTVGYGNFWKDQCFMDISQCSLWPREMGLESWRGTSQEFARDSLKCLLGQQMLRKVSRYVGYTNCGSRYLYTYLDVQM